MHKKYNLIALHQWTCGRVYSEMYVVLYHTNQEPSLCVFPYRIGDYKTPCEYFSFPLIKIRGSRYLLVEVEDA